MWTITSEDVANAKERIKERRAEIEAKYAEALKSLDSDLVEIDAMERFAGDFAGKYAREEGTAAAEAETSLDAASASTNEGAHGSRWRLHLGTRNGDGALAR